MATSRNSVVNVLFMLVSVVLFAYFVYATVSVVTISSPVSGANLSGASYLLNSSITSNVSVDSVLWNVTNSTGVQVAIRTSTNTSVTSWNSTLNTTALTDGLYNVSIRANDSDGAVNMSVSALNVRVDNTAPTISFQGQTPGAGSYLSQTSIPVNISSVDAGVGLSTIRVFLYNSSWALVNNTNTTANARMLNFTGLTVEGAYYINVTANDSINNVNSSQVSRTITLDTTSPLVSAPSSPLNYGNYSIHTGIVTLNVSVSDAVTNISFVFFNITNGSGVQNATITATQEGSTSYYSSTLNTSEYLDGLYNVTVYVNDSAGNVNNSIVVTTVRIDNTDPVITLSCDRTALRTGEVITCTCSATDAVSGVNDSSLDYTARPSTGSSGSFITECTAVDYSLNSKTVNWSYSVTGGGSSSGGGASQSWTNNYAYDSKELSEQSALTTLLSAKNKVTIKVAGVSHYVGVKNVGLTSAELEMASTPVQFTLNVGDTKKFDLNSDGSYDVSVVLNNIVSGRANVTINSVNEKVVSTQSDSTQGNGNAAASAATTNGEPSESGSNAGIWIGVVVLVIIIVLVVFFAKKSKKHR
jgi:hypothetical protein